MALYIMTWDLPFSAEQLKTYGEKAKTVWIPAILKQPGVKEFRAYRNPTLTTPNIMIHMEFDSMASIGQYLESEDIGTIMADLKNSGVTNISAQIWGGSPVVPEPIRPGG